MVVGGQKSSVQVPVLPLLSSVTLAVSDLSILIFSIYHRALGGLTETMCENTENSEALTNIRVSAGPPTSSPGDSLWI